MEINSVHDTNFEDHGLFYATQDMINENKALSVNSGILYDLTDSNDVRIKHYKPSLLPGALRNIRADNACWYGIATVMSSGKDTLIWEY